MGLIKKNRKLEVVKKLVPYIMCGTKVSAVYRHDSITYSCKAYVINFTYLFIYLSGGLLRENGETERNDVFTHGFSSIRDVV